MQNFGFENLCSAGQISSFVRFIQVFRKHWDSSYKEEGQGEDCDESLKEDYEPINWVEVYQEKINEIEDLIFLLYSNSSKELLATITDKAEDLNALLQSLEEQGYMADLEDEVFEDFIAAPLEEDLGDEVDKIDKIDNEDSYEDIQASTRVWEAEPPSGAYPDLIVNFLYGEHPTASNGAHVCPYLAVHGLTRARQIPISINNAGSSNNVGDIGPHHRNAASAVGEAFSSHAFPASETHHRHWHSSNTFPSNNSVPSAEDPALPALPSHDRFGILRTESDRLHRTGSPMPSGYGANGFYPRTVNARPPPPVTSDFVHSQNHIHGHGGGQLYHPPSASSMHSGLISHSRRSRSRETLVPSRRVIQNIPAEQARMQGASAYPMSRGQDGDNMGWHQNNHFYGLQIEGFPPAPWVPLDHDSQRWAWFHRGQNPQNVPTEPINRNYYRHSYFSTEGVAPGRPGISLETPYQRHGYTRFPPSFP